MRLTDLNGTLRSIRIVDGRELHIPVVRLDEANAVDFDCPCGEGHKQGVSFRGRGAPLDGRPQWEATGDSVENLTLTPSINSSCWHGFVTEGAVR